MPFKRRLYPGIAFAFLTLMLLFSLAAAALSILPGVNAPLYVHLTVDNVTLDSGAAAIMVNGNPADYTFNGTYAAMISADERSHPFKVTVGYGINNYTQQLEGSMDGESDIYLDVPAWVVKHTVSGRLYTGDINWLTPWASERVMVTANGVPAEIDGDNYTAILYAPNETDVDVKVSHECGYLLSEKIVPMNNESNTTGVDMVIRPLSVYGDVYIDGAPADDATVYIYVNDRPYEPISAEAAYDEDGTLSRPMFHALLPGAHPGDRLQLTATGEGGSGMATQDAQDYVMFLTINLKDVDLNML